jgi:hypothetical protein
MLPKFELLEATILGKLKGLVEFKKALNYVALTYPNSEEGKETELFIANRIPYLESLSFNSEFPLSWNILYNADNLEDKNIKALLVKLNKFAKERTIEKLTVSTDIYTIDKNFIVIHGIKTLENARGIAQVLKEFKEYKIADSSVVISSENYKVVQVKKNIDEYITGDWTNKDIIPVERKINLPEPKPENTKKQPEQFKEDPTQNNPKKAQNNGKQNNNSPQFNGTQTDDNSPMNSMLPPTQEMPKKP